MRSFLFENIWLLSRKESRARRIQFHPKRNLIQGRNHTGKSSLIKTLFLTLGARPQGNLSKWDENTVSLVDFSVDGRKFRALHQSGNRALFSETGELLVATGEHATWSAKFADVTGFNLVLIDKQGRSVPADPRCFFLPFYINQDGSWQANWNTFIGLQQFKEPVGPILEYFSGIKPPEYYAAKAQRDAEQRILDGLKKELLFLHKAQERFGKKLPYSGPKIDPKNFQREITRLTAEITKLNRRQEELRDQVVKERDLQSSIHLQINLAMEALREYDADAKFLRSDARELLVCPLCNAEHSESFLDLLTYADDARSLRDITVRLKADATKIEEKLRETNEEMGLLEGQYRKISELLSTRKGDLQFSQVIESLGAEQAFQAFEEERSELDNDISKHVVDIDKHTDTMKRFTDKERASGIREEFRAAYASALHNLNLPPADGNRLSLTSRPSISGSGGPRSILAYYAGLWRVCSGQTGAFLVPLVIDSPNQQGQDDINLPKVIEFVSTKLPENTQVILGSEIDVSYEFDSKTVLDRPYQLLDEESFETIEAELEPLVQAMYTDYNGNR